MELPFDKTLFKRALLEGRIIWRKHTLEKMLARGISRAEILEVLDNGEAIQRYEYDKPFPSALLLGFPNSRPIHVVVSFDEIQLEIFVITAYEPDLTIFEPDFKTKR
jgi:hypothetical protein